MAIKNKDSFLNHIANQLNRPRRCQYVEKPTWQYRPQWNVLKDYTPEALVDVLKEQCKVIHTTFKRVDKNNLSTALLETIIEYGGESIITAQDERNDFYELTPFYESLLANKMDVHFWDSQVGYENIVFAEGANIGITFSDLTLAESGTVTLFNNKHNSRSISLLPKHFIAIIPIDTLVPRMSQATRIIHQQHASGKNIASSISFITGPSNSADIELNLVVGVHGPVKATYIVVE